MKILSKKINFNIKKQKIAFTLAETIIVVSILGILASILVPSLINKYEVSQNKTKLRKAMTMYNSLISKIVIDNRLTSQQALMAWSASNAANGCSATFSYVKAKSLIGDSHCTILMHDGTAWDMTDITQPTIATKSEYLNVAEVNRGEHAFKLFSEIDRNGSLRVNDIASATGSDKNNLVSLYKYLGYAVSSQSSSSACTCSGDNCCASKCAGKKHCVQKDVACSAQGNANCGGGITCHEFKPTDSCTGSKYYYVDEKGESFEYYVQKDGNSIIIGEGNSARHYRYNADGTITYTMDTPYNGASVNEITFDANGDIISYYNYDRGTCTKEYCSWDINPFDAGASGWGFDFRHADGEVCWWPPCSGGYINNWDEPGKVLLDEILNKKL